MTHSLPSYPVVIVAAAEHAALLAERDRLRKGLVQLREDICKHADDTYWCGPAETVCDRITEVLGDKWEQK
jgi:hypothetical protein